MKRWLILELEKLMKFRSIAVKIIRIHAQRLNNQNNNALNEIAKKEKDLGYVIKGSEIHERCAGLDALFLKDSAL